MTCEWTNCQHTAGWVIVYAESYGWRTASIGEHVYCEYHEEWWQKFSAPSMTAWIREPVAEGFSREV